MAGLGAPSMTEVFRATSGCAASVHLGPPSLSDARVVIVGSNPDLFVSSGSGARLIDKEMCEAPGDTGDPCTEVKGYGELFLVSAARIDRIGPL